MTVVVAKIATLCNTTNCEKLGCKLNVYLKKKNYIPP